MAASPPSRPGRSLLVVAVVLVGFYLGVFLGPTNTPGLGLDLRGGTTVTLTPRNTSTGQVVSQDVLNKSVDILRQRVNAFGVSEAEVAVQGRNVVISVPGASSQEVVQRIGQTAELQFRLVQEQSAGKPAASATPTSTAGATGSASPATPTPSRSAAVSQSPTASPSAPATASPSPTPATASPSPTAGSASPSPTAGSASPSPTAGSASPGPTASPSPSPTASGGPGESVTVPPDVRAQYDALDCTNAENRKALSAGDPTKPIVACSRDGSTKYLLAPAVIVGKDISSANAALDPQTGSWTVNLDLKSSASNTWADFTGSHIQQQVAIVLDGVVQSAPVIQSRIAGTTQITGNFSQHEAQDLANVLKFGSLPIAFELQTAEEISPTLGADQLRAGLIAGAIGLGLVILFSLVYYRGLGLVTIASLALSAALLYALITVLGHTLGYTLTLAGIAGFIVAVGITADSFVVYFERIRDELRDGRSVRQAVEKAWPKARRTIVSADFVSILAAAVLYWVSVGSVKGFAFTLGLSTLVDLFIVFLFTHPVLVLLSRTEAFGGGHAWTGLAANRMTRRAPGRPAGPAPAEEA